MNIAAILRLGRLSLKSEALIAEIRLRSAAQRLALAGFAALTALMALAFINIALYAWLRSLWGPVMTPLVIALANLLLAVIALAVALTRKPGADLQMAEELRNLAAKGLEDELAMVSPSGLLGAFAPGGDATMRLLVPAVTAIIAALRKRKPAARAS